MAEAAKKKLPFGVEKYTEDGRKVYSQEFMKTLLADIESGRTTAVKAIKDFGITPSLVYRWMRQGPSKPLGRQRGYKIAPRAAVKVAANGRTPLDELAAQYQHTGWSNPVDHWQIDETHLKLAVRYCKGEVSRHQVNFALKKAGIVRSSAKRVMLSRWLGAVMLWAHRNGYELNQVGHE